MPVVHTRRITEPERRHNGEAASGRELIPRGEAGAVEPAARLEPNDLDEDLADRGFQESAMLDSRGVAPEARGERGAGGFALIRTRRVSGADEGGEAVGPEVPP
jgi:hypothetical protein